MIAFTYASRHPFKEGVFYMNENLKERLKNAGSPEEAINIARKYGCDTEIRSNGVLDDDALDGVSGGETVVKETYTSYSVVVRHRDTGEVLCVMPY